VRDENRRDAELALNAPDLGAHRARRSASARSTFLKRKGNMMLSRTVMFG
jgi:hypothetical protein